MNLYDLFKSQWETYFNPAFFAGTLPESDIFFALYADYSLKTYLRFFRRQICRTPGFPASRHITHIIKAVGLQKTGSYTSPESRSTIGGYGGIFIQPMKIVL